MKLDGEKKCKNHCPNCGTGVEYINWGTLQVDDAPYYAAECEICGCVFHEVYEYSCTLYDKGYVEGDEDE